MTSDDKQTNASAGPLESMNRFLHAVARRIWAARFGGRWYRVLIVLSVAYALLLVSSRLLGLLSDWFEPRMVLALPAAAALISILSVRSPGRREAARTADTILETKDLLLTATLMRSEEESFGPLVIEAADATAKASHSRHVVAYRPAKPLAVAASVLALLAVASFALPQLDPFGASAERRRVEERRASLAEAKRAAQVRAEAVKAQTAEMSEEVAKALNDLTQTFKKLEPTNKDANLKQIQASQKRVGELWRQLGKKKLADAVSSSTSAMRFDERDAERDAAWKKELQSGSAKGLRAALKEVMDQAEKLGEAKDEKEKARLRQEMSERVKRLSRFAKSGAGSQRLTDALERAAAQLAMSTSQDLSAQALDALQQTLSLADMEAASIARELRELAQLEDALSAAQLAKAANDIEGLDGKGCEGCTSIADYEQFYRNLLSQLGTQGEGMGAGQGMLGPGRGKGGQAPEDDTLTSDFTSQLSRADVKAGRMLLEWKVQGMSDPGRASENYRRSIKEIKEGVGEAVILERVPPGYHESIRKYFDSLREDANGETPSE
jgi:hypothetical protein